MNSTELPNHSRSQNMLKNGYTLVKDQNHCQEAFEIFDIMRRENDSCDVILVSNDIQIPAHRVILCSFPYFRKMFSSDFKEKKLEQIEIKEVDSSALESLVKFVYTAEIMITEENVQKLLCAANLLQFPFVLDACWDFLMKNLHPANCLGIRKLAYVTGCQTVSKAADAYIWKHFLQVVEEEEFLELSQQRLIQLITSNAINIEIEDEVFECIIKWVRHDEKNRANDLPSLIKHIHFPMMSKQFFMETVNKEPLILQNMDCLKCVKETLIFHLADPEKRTSLLKQTKPRLYAKKLLVFGPPTWDELEWYDFNEQKWYSRKIQNTPHEENAEMVVLDNELYLIGGFSEQGARTIHIYDNVTNCWRTGVPMNVGRWFPGVIALEGKIYVIGGFSANNIALKSAEVFNPTTQRWEMIAPMQNGRMAPGIGILNGYIYIIGGYDLNSEVSLDTVERYNPATNMWETVCSMLSKRGFAGAGTLNGNLYIVGGHDGDDFLNTIDKFNPDTNVWEHETKMNVPRGCPGVTAYTGSLYIAGGEKGQDAGCKSVEVYSPQDKELTFFPNSFKFKRRYTKVGLLYDPPVIAENVTTKFLPGEF